MPIVRRARSGTNARTRRLYPASSIVAQSGSGRISVAYARYGVPSLLGGVMVWSVFTALGGLTRNFFQLFVCRSMVGVGEAAYSPAAQSLIADFFPSKGRALALGIFWGGLALGGVAGIWLGGELEHLYGWRAAFLAVGIPGFVLAMLVAQLRDPTRYAGKESLWSVIRRFELPVWRFLKVTWTRSRTLWWGSSPIASVFGWR